VNDTGEPGVVRVHEMRARFVVRVRRFENAGLVLTAVVLDS
jgi:hypothetical protein